MNLIFFCLAMSFMADAIKLGSLVAKVIALGGKPLSLLELPFHHHLKKKGNSKKLYLNIERIINRGMGVTW